MKTVVFIFAAVMLFLASCKKDHQAINKVNPQNVKKYPVQFTVSQFEQTTTDFYKQSSFLALARKRNLSAAVADTSAFGRSIFDYYYLVYDEKGNEVRRITRSVGSPESKTVYVSTAPANGIDNIVVKPDSDPYNVITDSLAAGTYTVVIAGHGYSDGADILIDDANEDPDSPVYLPLSTATVYTGQGLNYLPRSVEIFFGKAVFTVAGPTNVGAITLNRIVGKVEVDLKDAIIPANVHYIILGRAGELNGYSIANETPNTPSNDFDDPIGNLDNDYTTLSPTDYTKGLYVMQRFVLNTASPIDVVINAYDSNNVIVTSKTIPHVQIQKNRRTVLSGKLFDNSVPAQFTIGVNQEWGPDAPPIGF